MNGPTRRQFAKLSAFAALGMSVSLGYGEEFDYPWKLGIITDEAGLDLAKVLNTFYPKYHLRWAEIRNLELDGTSKYVYKSATPAQLRDIKKQLDDKDVKVSVLDSGVYKIALPGTTPLGENAADLNPETGAYSNQLEDLKRAADSAHALGTDRVRIFAFKRVADPNAIFDRVVDELGKAIAVAKKSGITLVLENESDAFNVQHEALGVFLAQPDFRSGPIHRHVP